MNPRVLFAASILVLVGAFSAPAAATTVTGTINLPDGTPVTGTIEFVLSQRAITTTPPILYVPEKTACAVTSGAIDPGCTVQGNDTLDPVGTFYRVRILDANNRALGPTVNYTISGATVDLGALPVSATATLVAPDGSVTGNLNVTGNLTVGGSADFGADPQEFDHLRLRNLIVDPATVVNGSLWHRSDLDRLRFQVRGLQLYDGTQFVDITAGTNSIDISGDLKVGGGTDLGGFADLKCSSEPAAPGGNATRLYCLSTDQQYFFKDSGGVPFGPLASLNRASNWPASQNFKVINNIRFADQFPGADAGAKIAACLTDLPAGGGTCDARGLEGSQTISTNIFAGPLNKPMRLLLGHAAFAVTVPQVVDCTPIEIEGSGRLTVLDWQGGNNATILTVRNPGGCPLQFPRQPVRNLSIQKSNGATGITFLLVDAPLFSEFSSLNLRNLDGPGDNSIGVQFGTPTATRSTDWNWLINSWIESMDIGIRVVGSASFAANVNYFLNNIISNSTPVGVEVEEASLNLFIGTWFENIPNSGKAFVFKNGAGQNTVIGGGAPPFPLTNDSPMVEFQAGAVGNDVQGFFRDFIDNGVANSCCGSSLGAVQQGSGNNVALARHVANAQQFSQWLDATPQGLSGDVSSPSGGIGLYENLLTRSEELNHADWTKDTDVTIGANTTVAPDGTLTADTVSNITGNVLGVRQDTGIAAASKTATLSVWLRTTSGQTLSSLTLTDGVSEDKNCNARVDTVWRRYACTLEFSAGSTGTIEAKIMPCRSSACSVVAWGAQLRDTTDYGPLLPGEGFYHPPGIYVATVANPVSLAAGLAFNRGVYNDGRGFKHARVSTGSIAAGDSAAVTATWTTPFEDTNYTVIGCEVEDATAATLALRKHHVESRTAAALTVRLVNDDGDAAHSGTLHCTAVHD